MAVGYSVTFKGPTLTPYYDSKCNTELMMCNADLKCDTEVALLGIVHNTESVHYTFKCNTESMCNTGVKCDTEVR